MMKRYLASDRFKRHISAIKKRPAIIPSLPRGNPAIRVSAIAAAAVFILVSPYCLLAADPLYDAPISEEQAKADAVVLLKEETLTVEGRGHSYFEQRTVKKILKNRRQEEGLFTFPDNPFMEILDISAKAVYPDGREKTLTLDDIPRVPDFSDYIMYSDQASRSVHFDGVRKGTVLDISVRWKIKSPIYWPAALFASDIPVRERVFTLISGSDAGIRITGYRMDRKPDTEKELPGGRVEDSWVRRDIAAFESEKMMPPAIEYFPMLMFAPGWALDLGAPLDLGTWRGIGRWYEKLSGESLEPGNKVRDMLARTGAAGRPPQEAAAAIYGFVSRNVRYVAILLGLGGFRPHKAEETAEKLYGDCKDQSTLLTCLLREAGIEAWPVLVRTADRGSLAGIAPYPGYFNHAITVARIGGEDVFLDPTSPSCSFGSLPMMDQGADAMVIRDGEEGLIKLPSGPPGGNRHDVESTIAIDPSGSAVIEETITCTGSFSEMNRSTFTGDQGSRPEDTAKKLLARIYPFVEVTGIDISGLDTDLDPFTMKVGYTIPGFAKPGRKIFLDAIPRKLNPPFPSGEERKFPLVIGKPQTGIYKFSMEMPEGWKPQSLPDSITISSEYFSYKGSWSSGGGAISFSRDYRVKNVTVPLDDIPAVVKDLKKIKRFENTKILVVDEKN